MDDVLRPAPAAQPVPDSSTPQLSPVASKLGITVTCGVTLDVQVTLHVTSYGTLWDLAGIGVHYRSPGPSGVHQSVGATDTG